MALALVRGLVERNEGADDLVVDAFDDMAQAAVSHAYLAGFLLQALAEQRRERVSETVAWIGTRLADA